MNSQTPSCQLYPIKQLRERLEQYGTCTLSTSELLTIVLHTGSGRESALESTQALLASFSLQELLQADFGEVCREYGLGKAKAVQLQAVLELARRLTLPSSTDRYRIISPGTAANLVMQEMAFLDHEELRVLVLDTKNYVIANVLLYKGTINSSVLRVSELFRLAIKRNGAGIIVCHNHPSNSLEPSEEDIAVTVQLAEAGKLLDVALVDHLIIGNQRFVSLKERLRW